MMASELLGCFLACGLPASLTLAEKLAGWIAGKLNDGRLQGWLAKPCKAAWMACWLPASLAG